ncbi:hypothetical protein WOLCODRAFT_144945 [Wolfiporia cocos MD-104 SS10]|uniref:Uncharacterized protein n=1 Tax=Wolfiporia cocos (strain MD-104) TaxID=742152 RepID=A0A2H3K5Q2_WOLCO|nr:hypothetical protein WOLCODRAFT_144945 [Wolfiporia cocos MD-104 SS10]
MAKKNMASNPPKQQAPSMPSAHSHTVGAIVGASPQPEDDDDDICPVCESECTCQNRANPYQSGRSNAVGASAPSISSFNGSVPSTSTPSASTPSTNVGLQSLKIKLTVPPSLKFRKHATAGHPVNSTSSSHPRPLYSSSLADGSQPPNNSLHAGAASHHLTLGAFDHPAQKRKGRLSKAVVVAREGSNASHTGVHGTAENAPTNPAYASTGNGKQVTKYVVSKRNAASGKGKQTSKGRITTGRKGLTKAKDGRKSFPSHDFSDDDATELYPTFVPAASTSSITSSSESSDSESDLSSLDSEIEEETRILLRGEQAKLQGRRHSSDDAAQRGHGTSNWEIRTRKSSVGLDESDADVDSGDSSDAENGESDEGSDSATEDEEVDADTEGGGLEEVEFENEETGNRIGVSYGDGTAGWSDDEESSFDADLFFANLDGSSDSDTSPVLRPRDTFSSISDCEFTGSLSADEEDALLLMDIDPSVQVRRGPGEFEFGVELDTLSFGWDGQLLLTSTGPHNIVNLGYIQQGDADANMHVETESDSDSTEGDSTIDEMVLEESDGETTEDELVDSDGLPNSRAMMLFRWPTTVSAINPLSTMGHAANAPQAPPNASESVRIALASYPAHQGSPVPTPADILAGKLSLNELEDIEMDKTVSGTQSVNTKRSGRGPTMGEFVAFPEGVQASAVIDGKGSHVPSPFPRTKRSSRRYKSSTETEGHESSSGVVDLPSESVTQSSDETPTQSQTQISEMSSTEVIELDDVLDPSFLDCEPLTHDGEASHHGLERQPSPLASRGQPLTQDSVYMAAWAR